MQQDAVPKLIIHQPDHAPKPVQKSPALPPPRPCPRCRVTLQPERSYLSKGLSGQSSVEYLFRCPACDARFHWTDRTGRWRELTED